MSAFHPKVRERKQREQLRRVLGQATKARLHITELALDHPKWMLDLGPHLRLDPLATNRPFNPKRSLLRATQRHLRFRFFRRMQIGVDVLC